MTALRAARTRSGGQGSGGQGSGAQGSGAQGSGGQGSGGQGSGGQARPALGWSDLSGARVGLWGLRMEGAANLRRLRRMGVTPVVVDDRPLAPVFGGLRVLSGAAGLEALASCEVVVKSPGISRHGPQVQALVDAGVAVTGGLGLWLQDVDRARVMCVTGTKGKSTTAALAGHLLAGLGVRSLVAGNIGLPPWDPDAGEDWDVWVVETSSFQAADVPSSPSVVAVTSLAPDHLDWHGSEEAYYADKLSLCSQPGALLTVADASSEILRAHAALLGPEVWWVAEGDPSLDGPWTAALGLPGRHARRNALVARACLIGLGVSAARDDERVARAAAGFTPLAHRFHPIGVVDGVEFVDDSLSTNVLPTLAALDTLGDRPVALLVGGQDRGIDYLPLAHALTSRRARTLVATLPAVGRRIGDAVRAQGGEAVDFEALADATAAAFEWALRHTGTDGRPGVVLLSPAAPSFGQFRDYRERAAAFAAAMHECARSPGAGRLTPRRPAREGS
jgi:UDP-N-acetylmuramoylalanine--D-glutamate ligase